MVNYLQIQELRTFALLVLFLASRHRKNGARQELILLNVAPINFGSREVRFFVARKWYRLKMTSVSESRIREDGLLITSTWNFESVTGPAHAYSFFSHLCCLCIPGAEQLG